MPRKATPQGIEAEVIAAGDDISHVGDAANELVLAQQRINESAVALAHQLKYDGPLTPDALETGIRDSQQRVSLELFNIGQRLLLLKEQCAHGEFMERIERLDLSYRMAAKFMQVSLKFSNVPSTAHLQKLGKTKLIELLALDDEEVEALTEDGSVRGITLDEIDSMSCSELRKQLRESRKQGEAKDKLLATKNQKIDELFQASQTDLTSADEHLQQLHTKLAGLTGKISATLLTDVRRTMTEITDHHTLHGGDSGQIMNGHLLQISCEIADLRDGFALHTMADGRAEWEGYDGEGDAHLQDDLLGEQEA
ncbi:hypothetical protein [Gynuella sp.]|uniref:hypothetical protein n=1 Tax=Gynuella sp. TaxID=2969146 RepID=UPI003D11074D